MNFIKKDNILQFSFDSQKELTLTFFRIQEYYESALTNIVGKKFSVFDFLNGYLDDAGKIDYFSFWSGFNFPDDVLKEWFDLNSDSMTI